MQKHYWICIITCIILGTINLLTMKSWSQDSEPSVESMSQSYQVTQLQNTSQASESDQHIANNYLLTAHILDSILEADGNVSVHLYGVGKTPGRIFAAVYSFEKELVIITEDLEADIKLICEVTNLQTGEMYYSDASAHTKQSVFCNFGKKSTLDFSSLRSAVVDRMDFLIIKKRTKKDKVNLAMMTMAFNEGKYLQEWIEFHKLLGVERFWIIDNQSTDETQQVLAPYIASGLVECISWPWLPINQPSACNYILYLAKEQAEWLSWVDADLFFLPVTDSSLTDAINRYQHMDIIYVFYISFGSSGFATDPPGLVVENYSWRQLPRNKFLTLWRNSGFTIFRVSKITATKNIHIVLHEDAQGQDPDNPGFCCDFCPWYCSENDTRNFVAVDMEILRANHYAIKSEERFRNHKTKMWNRERLNIAAYDFHDEEDFTIMKFVPKLREVMGMEPPGGLTNMRISRIGPRKTQQKWIASK